MNNKAISILHHTSHGEIVGAARDTKLLYQKVIDKLTLRILTLLNSQKLRQLWELLRNVGSIRWRHLVPVRTHVVSLPELRKELISQVLVLPQGGEVVVFLHPIDLDDSEGAAALRACRC